MMNSQDANNNFLRSYYKIVLPYIKDGSKLLNIGCGSMLNFERVVKKNKNVNISSMDIAPLSKKNIKFTDEFIQQSVEEQFILDKKFDVITFFELIEHIDKTDILLKNCFNNLKKDGLLIFSFPNLSSIYGRIELLLGYQPHVTEVSNENPNFGTGVFGKQNNPNQEVLHHLRGFTYRAMKDFIVYSGFEIQKIIGHERRCEKLFYYIPSLAGVVLFICKKK